MEPLIIIIVPGVVGGILVALLMARLHARQDVATRQLEPPRPGLINMARIPISGVGGLGMVAMAATVAIFVPRIRLTMAIALVLGAAMAAAMIVRRRRSGPLPSSSDHSGAHSFLPIDPEPDAPSARDRDSNRSSTVMAPVPAAVALGNRR